MALIRCPGCNRRVSNRVQRCAHCGAAIAGAGAEARREARQAGEKRSRSRLRIQLLAAVTLFVAGALWLIFVNLRGNPDDRALPAVVTVAGLVWYGAIRVLLWLRRR